MDRLSKSGTAKSLNIDFCNQGPNKFCFRYLFVPRQLCSVSRTLLVALIIYKALRLSATEKIVIFTIFCISSEYFSHVIYSIRRIFIWRYFARFSSRDFEDRCKLDKNVLFLLKKSKCDRERYSWNVWNDIPSQ
jgi:hypothetical protein